MLIELNKLDELEEQIKSNLCCLVFEETVIAEEEKQRTLQYTIYYEPIPEQLSKALALLHPQEAEDITDAYMVWRSCIDNLEFEGLPVQARKARLDIIHERGSYFRKQARSRVDFGAKYLLQKSICSFDETGCLVIPDEFLPKSHWSEASPTRSFFTQELDDAKMRVIKALGAEVEVQPFPDGPQETMPSSVKAKYDFRFMWLGGVALSLNKGQVITDPYMVRHLVKGGFPICSPNQDIFEYCKHCGTKNPKPEEDTSEEIRYLRPKRNYTAFFSSPLSGQMRCAPDVLVEEPAVVNWFLNSGWPVQILKAHEFVKCSTCNKVTFLTPVPDE